MSGFPHSTHAPSIYLAVEQVTMVVVPVVIYAVVTAFCRHGGLPVEKSVRGGG